MTLVEVPPPWRGDEAPGVFRLAAPACLRRELEACGFSLDPREERARGGTASRASRAEEPGVSVKRVQQEREP